MDLKESIDLLEKYSSGEKETFKEIQVISTVLLEIFRMLEYKH